MVVKERGETPIQLISTFMIFLARDRSLPSMKLTFI